MNTKKYLVIGGYVRSKNDGQKHYIPAHRLVDLYNVSPSECILTDSKDMDRALCGIHPNDRSKLIRLFPRYDGDYRITTASRR